MTATMVEQSAVVVCTTCGDVARVDGVQGVSNTEVAEFLASLGWAVDPVAFRVSCPDHGGL